MYMPATSSWLAHLRKVAATGEKVSPRGMMTFEVRNALVEYDAASPVVVVPERGLSARFLSGEALWILSGSDRVADIAPYNKRIANYSDDGETFFGAYGPRIESQIGWVADKLARDPESRQAVLTIWREKPPETKDVPCTVAMSFAVRSLCVHATVFMRSSDVWLGLPYDMFNFAMVQARLTCALSTKLSEHLQLGSTAIFAASSHLYERDLDAALRVLEAPFAEEDLEDVERSSFGSRHAMRGMATWHEVEKLLADARDWNHLPELRRIR